MEPETDTTNTTDPNDPMATLAELSRKLCEVNERLAKAERGRDEAEKALAAQQGVSKRALDDLREMGAVLKSFLDEYSASPAHQRALRAAQALQRSAALVSGGAS